MPSVKHEAALHWTISSLGGEWKTNGFRRELADLLEEDVECFPVWIPDAYRLITDPEEIAKRTCYPGGHPEGLLEVIEVGNNDEQKWERICYYWTLLDSWYCWEMTLYSVHKESLRIDTITDAQLAHLRLSRLYRRVMMPNTVPPPVSASEAEDGYVLRVLKMHGLEAARAAREKVIAERSVRNPEIGEAR